MEICQKEKLIKSKISIYNFFHNFDSSKKFYEHRFFNERVVCNSYKYVN